MQETQEQLKTTNGSIIQKNLWYIYRWSTKEEPDGFISEGFRTKREAIIESGTCGQFHREGFQYYTCNRTHVCTGRALT